MPLVDALKAVASQFIVLHHLAAYGPMSDVVSLSATALFDWLYCHARMAVQVFFVIGGFLAAKTLAPDGIPGASSPSELLWRRYCRLALPYVTAIVLSIVCASIARAWMDHESVPAAPTPTQLLAHVLMLHDILGYEALSAGVWYVAIDFQLFALLAVLLQVRGATRGAEARLPWSVPLLLLLLGTASLFYFNRDAAWDAWAPYFAASYGLGVLVYWTVNRIVSPVWLAVLAASAMVAVMIDFRPRLLVALTVAGVITIAHHMRLSERWRPAPWLSFLGRISYSLFLVHFPVCILINAIVFRYFHADPTANAAGLLVAWIASIGAGWVLYETVERRTERFTSAYRSRRRTAAAPS
jgi:peptidoglycan/LPS O-acetylase OafA/YrhL